MKLAQSKLDKFIKWGGLAIPLRESALAHGRHVMSQVTPVLSDACAISRANTNNRHTHACTSGWTSFGGIMVVTVGATGLQRPRQRGIGGNGVNPS
jgi:hypothetical protein